MIAMFEEIGMVTEEEAQSRYTAYAERYVTQLTIESRVLIDIANKNILPSAIRYANNIAENIEKSEKFGKELVSEQENILKSLLFNINEIRKEIKSLEESIKAVKSEEDLTRQTDLAAGRLILGLKSLRKPCDEIEKVTDSSIWTLPTYSDLLFKL